MSKIAMLRFFAVVAVVTCVVTCVVHVSADVQLKGPGSKLIVVSKDTFDYKMDYTKTYAFYNKTNKFQQQAYTLDIGGCKVAFITQRCDYKEVNNRHHTIKNVDIPKYTLPWLQFHDDFPFGTVKSSSISFHGTDFLGGLINNQNYPCSLSFDNSVAGKYVVDVRLTGEVAPDLIVNFPGAELFTTTTSTTTLAPTTTTLAPTTTTLAPITTTQAPTTLSTTQASSSTLLTSTPAIISSTVKTCPQCEERGIEAWLIGLIVAIIVLAILAIILCAVLFCCYRRMQKAKAQKIVQNDQTTVKCTMSTAPGPLVKETNLYGPDMMYFGRDATPVDPNAKSQAANIAPQAISPAPATSPMQAPQ